MSLNWVEKLKDFNSKFDRKAAQDNDREADAIFLSMLEKERKE